MFLFVFDLRTQKKEKNEKVKTSGNADAASFFKAA